MRTKKVTIGTLKNISKKVTIFTLLTLFSSTPFIAFADEYAEPPTAETEISQDYVEWQGYLELQEVDLGPTPRNAMLRCVVGVNQGSTLNVRSGPSTNHSVVGSLRPGQFVHSHVMSNINVPSGWFFATSPVRGYVSTQFLASGNPHTGQCPM